MTLQEVMSKYVPAEKLEEAKQAMGGHFDYVPRARLNEVISARDTAVHELDEHKAKSAKYDEAQTEITGLKQKVKDTVKEWEGKFKQKERDDTIAGKLRDAHAKNVTAVVSLLDATKFGDDMKGLDEEIKRVQKSDPYLFGEDGSRGTGAEGGNKGGEPEGNKLSDDAQKRMMNVAMGGINW
jgi:HAMP domain-containing protein